MQPDYFKPHIQSGIALFNMGKKTEAEPFLKRANELLPTAPGHALLGQIAEGRGQTDVALQHYQVAASSNSDIGKDAVARAVRIDLPRNPAKYIKSGIQSDHSGNLFAVVQNDTPVVLSRVQVRVVQYNANGRAIGQSQPLLINGVASGKRNQVTVGTRITDPKAINFYKVVVEAASISE
jgi:tetratricopeptide (TPR) repeat protein